MTGLNVIVIGAFLVAWVAILAVIIFRNDGKLPGFGRNRDILLPVGTVLFVWMWIFALVFNA